MVTLTMEASKEKRKYKQLIKEYCYVKQKKWVLDRVNIQRISVSQIQNCIDNFACV